MKYSETIKQALILVKCIPMPIMQYFKFKKCVTSAVISSLLLAPIASADINQSGPNIYICEFTNALILIQFNDISGKLVGNYRDTTLVRGGTSEHTQEQSFTGEENNGSISISFQYGNTWIGKVRDGRLDFEIPNFIVGEPLSSVVFRSATVATYNQLQFHMTSVINHNIMVEKMRANLVATNKRRNDISERIVNDYRNLQQVENINVVIPETIQKKYTKQIESVKELINEQIALKGGRNFYGKDYKIDSLNYEVNSDAYNVNSINYDLIELYSNEKNAEKAISDNISSISKDCQLMMDIGLSPLEQRANTVCANENHLFAVARNVSAKINKTISSTKKIQILYNQDMKTLQEKSASIR